jgi:hypothetical protein
MSKFLLSRQRLFFIFHVQLGNGHGSAQVMTESARRDLEQDFHGGGVLDLSADDAQCTFTLSLFLRTFKLAAVLQHHGSISQPACFYDKPVLKKLLIYCTVLDIIGNGNLIANERILQKNGPHPVEIADKVHYPPARFTNT